MKNEDPLKSIKINSTYERNIDFEQVPKRDIWTFRNCVRLCFNRRNLFFLGLKMQSKALAEFANVEDLTHEKQQQPLFLSFRNKRSAPLCLGCDFKKQAHCADENNRRVLVAGDHCLDTTIWKLQFSSHVAVTRSSVTHRSTMRGAEHADFGG